MTNSDKLNLIEIIARSERMVQECKAIVETLAAIDKKEPNSFVLCAKIRTLGVGYDLVKVGELLKMGMEENSQSTRIAD